MAKVLLIEPDRLIAGNIHRFLTNAGHNVISHQDLQAAITSTDQDKPQIIISDLLLAGRSGIEFLFELRSYPEWLDIPLIAFGNHPYREIESYSGTFKQLNIRGYLHKPAASLYKLLDAIEEALAPAKV